MIRVLFVDDDDAAREDFAAELRQAGLEVIEAGLEVIEERLAEASIHSLNRYVPDVLLLAIGMPPGESDAIDLLIRLRGHALWRHLPVIVLSWLGNPRYLDVMPLGVCAVLTRPEVTARDVARLIEATPMP